jgi:hypothetical protein
VEAAIIAGTQGTAAFIAVKVALPLFRDFFREALLTRPRIAATISVIVCVMCATPIPLMV